MMYQPCFDEGTHGTMYRKVALMVMLEFIESILALSHNTKRLDCALMRFEDNLRCQAVVVVVV